MALEPDLRDAYLQRLGLEAEPPSADALQRLHRRQVERIPYETMWIHAGETWDIDPVRSAERIAFAGRGGYCFHLNGAFAELLATLGYAVTRHVGGVHGPAGPDQAELTNHLVLTVADLRTDENPSGTWYADAGLGDALHEALPLAPGEHRTGPWRLVLEATPGGVGDWELTHDAGGGFAGMSWRSAETGMEAFADRHRQMSTDPDSGFVRVATAQRRDRAGVDVVRGLVFRRIGGSAPGEEVLTRREDWFGVLADVFDLRFDGMPHAALDALWARCLANHRAWEAAGRPESPRRPPLDRPVK
jgi:arylamine N-acetyltransferase